jgi:hypothetical protein
MGLKETKLDSSINVIWKQPVELNEIKEPLLDSVRFLNPQYITILRGVSGSSKTLSLIYHGLGGKMITFDENGIKKDKSGNPITAKYEVYIHECAIDQLPQDLIGSYILRGGDTDFVASSILSAFKSASEGKNVLLIFDEINLLRQEVLKSINSVMDDRKSIDSPIGRFSAGDNLILAGTMNSEIDSAGYDLDPQLRSRAIIPPFSIKEFVKKNKNIFKSFGTVVEKTEGLFSLRELEKLWLLTKVFDFNQQEAIDILLNGYEEQKARTLKDTLLAAGVIKPK